MLINADLLEEALEKARADFQNGAQQNLSSHLQASDLPAIKYAAGQLNALDIMFQRVFTEIKRLREES